MTPVLVRHVDYDAFRLLAAMCAKKGIPLGSEEAASNLAEVVGQAAMKLAGNPIHIFGSRTEAMFYVVFRP